MISTLKRTCFSRSRTVYAIRPIPNQKLAPYVTSASLFQARPARRFISRLLLHYFNEFNASIRTITGSPRVT